MILSVAKLLSSEMERRAASLPEKDPGTWVLRFDKVFGAARFRDQGASPAGPQKAEMPEADMTKPGVGSTGLSLLLEGIHNG